MNAFSSNEEKILFLENLALELQKDILYNCSIAGINADTIEVRHIDIKDYLAALPANTSDVEHFAFVSVARSINKLNVVNEKLKELKNA